MSNRNCQTFSTGFSSGSCGSRKSSVLLAGTTSLGILMPRRRCISCNAMSSLLSTRFRRNLASASMRPERWSRPPAADRSGQPDPANASAPLLRSRFQTTRPSHGSRRHRTSPAKLGAEDQSTVLLPSLLPAKKRLESWINSRLYPPGKRSSMSELHRKCRISSQFHLTRN